MMSFREKRKQSENIDPRLNRPTEVPADYLRMVSEVFHGNFEEGLKAYAKRRKNPRFEASGALYLDEVVLSMTLADDDSIAATTVHVSADFDPTASAPKAEDLLAACVDAAGALFGQILDPKAKNFEERIDKLSQDALSELVDTPGLDLPFEWTEVQIDKKRLFLKIDKSNPLIESMTERWLDQNDPDRREKREQDQEEAEARFITGKKTGNGHTEH